MNKNQCGDCDIEKLSSRVTIIESRIDEIKDEQLISRDDRNRFFEKLSETQKILSERVVALETEYVHTSKMLESLIKESSLQTKILSIILTAIVGGVVTFLLKR